MTKADAGDAEGAARTLMSGFAVVGSLKEEPVLLSQLVRIACLAIELEALEWTVNRVRLDAGMLKDLERAAEQAEVDGKRGMHRAVGNSLMGERRCLG